MFTSDILVTNSTETRSWTQTTLVLPGPLGSQRKPPSAHPLPESTYLSARRRVGRGGPGAQGRRAVVGRSRPWSASAKVPAGSTRRAAAWGQGARPAERACPRKTLRQRVQGPACRLHSRVSLFKAERGKDGEMESKAEGRGAGSWGRKWSGQRSREGGGRRHLRLVLRMRAGRAQSPGRTRARWASRLRPPGRGLGRPSGQGRWPHEVHKAGPGPGGEAGTAGLLSGAGESSTASRGDQLPWGAKCHVGTRAEKHAQHRAGTSTLTIPGDSKRTEWSARSPPGDTVCPSQSPSPSLGLSLSLAAGLSFRPCMPGCRVWPGKVPGENPTHPTLHPLCLPQTLLLGISRAVPFSDAGTVEAPQNLLWASSWRAHPHVVMT